MEGRLGVALPFRFPLFRALMWHAASHYAARLQAVLAAGVEVSRRTLRPAPLIRSSIVCCTSRGLQLPQAVPALLPPDVADGGRCTKLHGQGHSVAPRTSTAHPCAPLLPLMPCCAALVSPCAMQALNQTSLGPAPSRGGKWTACLHSWRRCRCKSSWKSDLLHLEHSAATNASASGRTPLICQHGGSHAQLGVATATCAGFVG